MDILQTPIYSISEAARYVRLPAATLRSWVCGRPYSRRDGQAFFAPLIALPEPSSNLLSFANLVEAHVLRALREEHTVSVQAVRDALQYAQNEFGIDRLLLRQELRTAAGDLFLECYGKLINLSRSGQIAMKTIWEGHLKRVEWDNNVDLPSRLYPILPDIEGSRTVVIDARIAFGRPVLKRCSVSTAVIADRIDAGEEIDDLMNDYGLTKEEIQAAVVYERHAA